MGDQDSQIKNGGSDTKNSGLVTTTLAFIVIFGIAYLALSGAPTVNPINTPTLSPTAGITSVAPTVTPTLSPTAGITPVAPTVTPIATLTNVPVPTTRTLLPEIDIREWNIIPICKGKEAIEVQIVGAIIIGGSPSYWIDAHYRNGDDIPQKKAVAKNPLSPYKMSIIPPMLVDTGKNIIVTVRSDTFDEKLDWTGNWYFPRNSDDCAR